jgi:hypothetical protein
VERELFVIRPLDFFFATTSDFLETLGVDFLLIKEERSAYGLSCSSSTGSDLIFIGFAPPIRLGI